MNIFSNISRPPTAKWLQVSIVCLTCSTLLGGSTIRYVGLLFINYSLNVQWSKRNDKYFIILNSIKLVIFFYQWFKQRMYIRELETQGKLLDSVSFSDIYKCLPTNRLLSITSRRNIVRNKLVFSIFNSSIVFLTNDLISFKSINSLEH